MYLGQWNMKGPKGFPTCHGFGVYYHHPDENKGSVYNDERQNGMRHGPGKECWLESAPKWKNNKDTRSSIQEYGTGRPFVYSGTFMNNIHHDESATVTLKDGTTRVGPWQYGKPVGWWRITHKVVAAVIVVQQAARFVSATIQEEPTTTRTTGTTSSVSSSTRGRPDGKNAKPQHIVPPDEDEDSDESQYSDTIHQGNRIDPPQSYSRKD